MLIPLTQGKSAIVDDFVYFAISDMKWCLHIGLYAKSRICGQNQMMHRFIMQAKTGQIIDHINGDKLDNRLENLRICNAFGNARNKRKHNKKSIYKGVYPCGNKWKASVCYNRKQIHLGLFETEIKAALAYNEAALKYHGEFANINHF